MSALSFMNPLIALGALGVAAPIIIHFFFRRRARLLDFPPIRFVLLSYKKVARKLLLHEYLLLLTRCLMVALLALGIAGPLMSRMTAGIKRGEKPIAAVFIIDPSLSMTRTRNGTSLLNKAQNEALSWSDQLVENDVAGVIDAVRLKGSGLLKDRDKLRDAVSGISAAYAPARMPAALELASSWLTGMEGLDRMIVVFTDLQRTGWGERTGKESDLPPVYVVDVSEGMAPDNLSIGGVSIDWKSLAREEAVDVSATVVNHGTRDARQVLARVESGGQVLAQGFVDAPAGESVDKSFTLTEVPEGAGSVKIETDDGIKGDNTAWFHLKGGQEVRALVVDGDPGAAYIESETYFLDHALNPKLYARSRVSPRSATPMELADIDLADFQVLVLANVEKLDSKQVGRIKKFVENGGGLLFTLGDKVDANDYDAMWGSLLPRELRGVKEPYAGAAGSSEVRVMHLETPSVSEDMHPILSVFKDPAQGDLGLAGFTKYFLMQQELVPKTRVVLRLTDGVPIMVEGSYGRGKVIVFASTADRAWTDLCIHPVFLPLMQQTVQYLANALVEKDEGDVYAGSVVEMPVAADVTGALVMGPDSKIWKAELVEEEGARRIRIGETELPGVYWVKFLHKGDDPSARFTGSQADRTMVLNVDPAESDLTRITPREIEALVKAGSVTVISEGTPLASDAAAMLEKKSYAGALLMLLVGLAVLERALVRKG